MKRSVCIFVWFFISYSAFAQHAENFQKLIKQTNTYFAIYETLSPFGEHYCALNKLGLTKEEIKQVIKKNVDEQTLNPNKDSIEQYAAIEIIQNCIVKNIKKIVAHPDFNKNDITGLLTSNELRIVKSGDNKLYNFSFDAKNGGTYHMQVSIMHYTGFDSKQQIDTTSNLYSIFARDGYSAIDTICTAEGTKYLLTGSVQGCSHCFVSYVALIKVEKNTFVEEFYYSIDLRDYETGVSYNSETKTISVSYQTDDLTSYCTCENQANKEEEGNTEIESSESDERPSEKSCECRFVYDGRNFRLTKESWEIIETKD